jgi:CRP/FNR family transcriptional regulator, anaerobic regulatory protein
VETPQLRQLVLARFPVLKGLPEARLSELLAVSPTVRAPAGSVLFEASQPCRGFPLLLDGEVRVFKTAPNGREIVLYRVEAGEGCILSGGCLLGSTPYSATALAESDVLILNIGATQFHELMFEHEPFRRFVFTMYGERLDELMDLVEEVAFRRLDQRLAQLLIHRGPVIHDTHQKIADELGSVREMVSRLLRMFETRGWVALERECVTVLSPKGLAELTRS